MHRQWKIIAGDQKGKRREKAFFFLLLMESLRDATMTPMASCSGDKVPIVAEPAGSPVMQCTKMFTGALPGRMKYWKPST